MRWDVFCAVVDNLGDIGVCWRLARQLAAEHGATVRLWVDDLVSFRRLAPGIDAARDVQTLGVLEVRSWPQEFPADIEPADVVVETFGCELPASYVRSMKERSRAPVWINLEYLSAEPWVDRYHALPSPQPPLTKYFFFPGFSERTGGVLKERDLDRAREAFQSDADAQRAFLGRLGVPAREPGEILASLFCYPQAPLAELFAAWQSAGGPVTAVAFADTPAAQAMVAAGLGSGTRIGAIAGRIVPFLGQDDYDRVLWSCDWNFVRGEDSFVRAQWAARPFVWQAYPQQESNHRIKVQTFLARYLEDDRAPGLVDLWGAWNGLADRPQLTAAWAACVRDRGRMDRIAARWPQRLGDPGDLAGNLARFCMERV
ncbi:MAG TPA: elongation factor P maturation arginine rhamnosyltransferase EarP [Burkholderiales bacterium]|nr:elongation factor P maturation arginine rhamnosyltransferase EarP [Burkholderiales bacterium]